MVRIAALHNCCDFSMCTLLTALQSYVRHQLDTRNGFLPLELDERHSGQMCNFRSTLSFSRDVPIPGSARAHRTVVQKRVEELEIIGAGHLPVNEVRQDSGNAMIAKECQRPIRS